MSGQTTDPTQQAQQQQQPQPQQRGETLDDIGNNVSSALKSPNFWSDLAAFGGATSAAAGARTSGGFLANPTLGGSIGVGVLGAMEQDRLNKKSQVDQALAQAQIMDVGSQAQQRMMQNQLTAAQIKDYQSLTNPANTQAPAQAQPQPTQGTAYTTQGTATPNGRLGGGIASNGSGSNVIPAPIRLTMAQQATQGLALPANILDGVVRTESSWDAGAPNSSAGAVGLAQVLPSTASGPGYGLAPVNPDSLRGVQNAQANLRFGAQYLDALGKAHGLQTANDWLDPNKAGPVLAAYNGSRNVPAEQNPYVRKVFGYVAQGPSWAAKSDDTTGQHAQQIVQTGQPDPSSNMEDSRSLASKFLQGNLRDPTREQAAAIAPIIIRNPMIPGGADMGKRLMDYALGPAQDAEAKRLAMPYVLAQASAQSQLDQNRQIAVDNNQAGNQRYNKALEQMGEPIQGRPDAPVLIPQRGSNNFPTGLYTSMQGDSFVKGKLPDPNDPKGAVTANSQDTQYVQPKGISLQGGIDIGNATTPLVNLGDGTTPQAPIPQAAPQPQQPASVPVPASQGNGRLGGNLTPPTTAATSPQPAVPTTTPPPASTTQQPRMATPIMTPSGPLVTDISTNQKSDADIRRNTTEAYVKKLHDDASAANVENGQLQQAKLLTRSGLTTGYGTQTIAAIKNALGTTFRRVLPNVNVDSALQSAGTVEALNQIANENNVHMQNEAHGRSMAELNMLSSKSPGAGMSGPGLITTIAQMQGKNDYQIAEQQAYNEAAQAAARQGTTVDTNNFKQLFESKYSPAEFMMNRMNNEPESKQILGQYLRSLVTDSSTGQMYPANSQQYKNGQAQIAELKAKVADVQQRFRTPAPPNPPQLPSALTQQPQQPQPMLGNQ